MENPCSSNQDVEVAGPSRPKSPRIENSLLENLRASLKEEITSEIKNLFIESQKEMLKLLKPETRESVRGNFDEETENETRSFYTPTKSVRINSTQNDPNSCRNTPASKTLDNHRNVGNIDSENETVPPTTKYTPIKTRTTTHKNTPITSRNNCSHNKLIVFQAVNILGVFWAESV